MDESGVCSNCKPYFDELKQENDLLKKRLDELERRLQIYENAHTPPSRIRRMTVIEEKVKNKPGQGRTSRHYQRIS